MLKVMKIANIKETFVNKWVAAKVTKMNKANVPVAGEVVTHSPDKSEVYRTVKAYLAQHPAARMSVFFTGDPIPESVEVMLAAPHRCQENYADLRGAKPRGIVFGEDFV